MPVREITDTDLVRRAVMNARPRGMGSAPRWAAVMDTFALGSTYAWELCEATGFDPEAQVSGATCPRCEENAAEDAEEPEWQSDVQAAFGGIVQTPQC